MAARTVNSVSLPSSWPCFSTRGCARSSAAGRRAISASGRTKASPIVNTSGGLFPDAERREDPVQDIIRRGGAGNGVERPQGGVKIEQQHFVRNPDLGGLAGLGQRLQAFAQQLLVPEAGDEAGFPLLGGERCDLA